MDCLPWLTFSQTATRLGRSRSTIYRLVEAGILVRVFDGFRAKGITIESIASYESSIAYLNAKETGAAQRLPRSAQHLSPLHHVLITGRYPKVGASSAGHPARGGASGAPQSAVLSSMLAGARRG